MAFAPLTAEELEAAQTEAAAIAPHDDAVLAPPPVAAESGPVAAARLFGRKPDAMWRFALRDGETAFYACRWNTTEGKTTRPLSWIEGRGWAFKAWPDNRPLYQLDEIVARPDAPVVVVEGEKCADAAAAIFPSSIVTTSSGGSNAANKTDWAPLAGRRVLIWPDADDPGAKYAREVAQTLAALKCVVSVIDAMALASRAPNGGEREPSKGWDAADAAEEGRDLQALRKLAVSLAKPFAAPPKYMSFGPFMMSGEGLTVEVQKGRGDNATTETAWVSSAFEILGMTRDASGRGWGLWLRWRDADGRVHLRHVEAAGLQGEPATICAALASDGLRINRSEQRLFVSYLAQANPRGRITLAPRTGWTEIGGKAVFVLPSETIGQHGGEEVALDAAAHGPYEARGTLKDWQDGVGALIGGHALGVLAVSAALAGPLLYLAGFEGGGVNFYGPSSCGKTTILAAAASVWGRGGSPGFIRAWRATANGLEGAASSANDTALILDELGVVEARDAAAALYSLSNGTGKARSARDGSLRDPKAWRVMVLSTGELPVEAKLSEDRGRKARAGQLVRMLDVKCDRLCGAFDHPGPDGDAGKVSKAIKVAATTAFGTAGPAFVRALIREDVTGADVRSLVAAFIEKHVPAGADGQVDRAAQRLGLIAAAGEIAVALGIVPWSRGEATATAAAADALAGWIASRGGTESCEARQAVEEVRHIIEQHGEARFQPLDDPEAKPVSNRLGWRKGAGEAREWWVPSETWKAEICAGRDPVFVAKTLAERGMLRRQGGNILQCVVRAEGRNLKAYVLRASILEEG